MSNENYLKPESNKWDFTANSAILSFVAAAFGITLGVIGINSYLSYVSYYSYYGFPISDAIGYWIIVGLAVAAGAIGIISGVFTLVKKRFALTLIGPVLMLISGIVTFVVETIYNLGYLDVISIPAAMMIALSAIALPLLFQSKTAYVDYNAAPVAPEELDLPPEAPAEPEVTEQPAAE